MRPHLPIIATAAAAAMGCLGWAMRRSQSPAAGDPAASAAPIKAVAVAAAGPIKSASERNKPASQAAADALAAKNTPAKLPPAPLGGAEILVGSQPAMLTQTQLADRAAKVEREATRELERLIPLLDLTPAQQERVFDRLAQNSVNWHPAFLLTPAGQASSSLGGGFYSGPVNSPSASPRKGAETAPAPTTAAPAPVLVPEASLPPVKSLPDLLTNPADPILTPEQEPILLTDDDERRQWWEEMVEVMKNNMENTNGATTPPASGVGETKEEVGSGGLAD